MKPTHSAVIGSSRVLLAGSRLLGRANPHSIIEVTLKLRRKTEPPELTGPPTHMMTRQELGATYGASQADIDLVTGTFEKLGLKTVSTNAETRTVVLSGSIQQMEDA